MPADDNTRVLQAKRAAAKRWGRADEPDLARELATERIARYVKDVVASAPPLTAEQKDKIALLLGGSAA